MTKRVLIVVFDALKPEFVTPEAMPHLHAFGAAGVWCRNGHSTFLTETRVNQTAVTSGCMAHRHGVVANRFVDRALEPHRVIDTGKDELLEAAFERAGGKLIDVATLGQFLTRAGKSYATLSAGTSGGGRLINHSAAADGSFRYAMRRPQAACPAGVDRLIEARFGSLPEYELPAKAWITRAVDIYLDHIEPQVAPDVMLLWLCQPDESFHHLGIGSPGSLDIIRHVDAEFGRILARHDAAIARGDMQVIAMSDHGQISLTGGPVGVTERLRAGGFSAATWFDEGTDVVFAGSNAGGIWLRDDDPALSRRLTEWLLAQDWCGPIFTRHGTAGTLKLSDVFLDHPRAPEIALVMQAAGGVSMHDSPYPDGGGSHGGLSRDELHTVMMLGGTAFRASCINNVPVGNIDVTPTVLHLLGLPLASHFDGRILREALAGGPDPARITVRNETRVSTNTTGPKTHLAISHVDATPYLDKAWVA